MKKLVGAFLLLTASLAPSAIINVEFKFTPFLGDPATVQEVEAMPGKAQVFINNVPTAEQEVRDEKLPVLFETHEIAPAVWVPMSSAGPSVRKGKNKIRIEFTPNDTAKTYRAQLRWAAVIDEPPAEELDGGNGKATNQKGEGVDDRKEVKGKVVFEREFVADFALDLPWHHYPAVTELSAEDKEKIAALLKTRASWFQPNFAGVYKAIEDNESLKVEDVRKAQCVEAAYKAGVRVNAPAVTALNFVTTGGPEVVVSQTRGSLFGLDEKAFATLKDEDTQMCAATVLGTVYPGRMAFVRKPDGTWETIE